MPAHPLDPEHPTTLVSIKMSTDLIARARKKAEREGVTVSSVVREFLAKWVETESRKPKR